MVGVRHERAQVHRCRVIYLYGDRRQRTDDGGLWVGGENRYAKGIGSDDSLRIGDSHHDPAFAAETGVGNKCQFGQAQLCAESLCVLNGDIEGRLRRFDIVDEVGQRNRHGVPTSECRVGQ